VMSSFSPAFSPANTVILAVPPKLFGAILVTLPQRDFSHSAICVSLRQRPRELILVTLPQKILT
jgi:hypothetical protein